MSDIDTILREIKPRVISWIHQDVAASASVSGGVNDHGLLTGLADDDHTQYVHISIARSISAQHSFAPAAPTAPFALSANAQGQLVTGLYADQLNKSVTAGAGLTGGGALSASISLAVGAGNGIQVNTDDVAVKLKTTSGLAVDSSGLSVGAGTLITIGTSTVGLSDGTAQYQVPLTGASPFTPAWATTSNNPTSIAVLRSDSNGYLTLPRLNVDVLADKSGGDLTIGPTGNIIVHPVVAGTIGAVLPATNWETDLGGITKKYRQLHVSELWVETLVAQETIATIGGHILVGPTTTLTSDVGTTQTNLCLNPGFETAGGGGADVFANWTEYYAGGGTIVRDSVTPHGGTYSCKVTRGTVTGTYVEQVISVTPGYGYTISFWTRGDGTRAGQFAVWDNAHAKFLVAWSTTSVTGTTWAKITFTVLAEAGDTTWNLAFKSEDITTGAYASFDDVAVYADYIIVKHNEMAPGDYVYLQTFDGSSAQMEWMKVLSSPIGAGPYTYYVWRACDGSTLDAWKASDAVFNTGGVSEGYIDLYATHPIRAPGTGAGPTITGTYRWGDGPTNLGETWAIGNLNGLYGYSADTYGLALGFYGWGWPYLTMDATNGIKFQFLDGTGVNHVKATWDKNGYITIGESTGPHVEIISNKISLYNGTDEMLYLSSYPAIRVGKAVNSAARMELYDSHLDFVYQNAGGSQLITMRFESNGNATFGRTDAGNANMSWDVGTGTLSFRAGTGTAQVTVNTSGEVTAGAGTVKLNASGIQVVSFSDWNAANAYQVLASDGTTLWGYFGANGGFGSPNIGIRMPGSTVTHTIEMNAGGIGAGTGVQTFDVWLQAFSQVVEFNITNNSSGIGVATLTNADFIYHNDLRAYRNSTTYTGYIYVPLSACLGSTSWDGDLHSTTGKTVIDLSSVFGVPAGVKAVTVRLYAKDSGSSGGAYWVGLSPNNTSYLFSIGLQLDHVANNSVFEQDGICPCDAGGDIYYQIAASGTNTMAVWLEISGYFI